MKFYTEKKPLYFETDVSGVGLGTGLLHIWEEIDDLPERHTTKQLHIMTNSIHKQESVQYINAI